MNNDVIYQAVYVCKLIDNIGLPGYSDVVLGLPFRSGNSDILIKGTYSRFIKGRI